MTSKKTAKRRREEDVEEVVHKKAKVASPTKTSGCVVTKQHLRRFFPDDLIPIVLGYGDPFFDSLEAMEAEPTKHYIMCIVLQDQQYPFFGTCFFFVAAFT
jgi:hypothetical protein